MILSIIAAMDRNHLIGNKNQLPWHLPADFKHFKAVTMAKPIIMGRKTFESIGKPLPGRSNIVLSRNPDCHYDGVTCVTSFADALAVIPVATIPVAVTPVATPVEEEIMIIGGSGIYQMLLPQVNRMYLTFVEAEFSGDAWFPEFDENQWLEKTSVLHQADKKNAYDCRFVTLERRSWKRS